MEEQDLQERTPNQENDKRCQTCGSRSEPLLEEQTSKFTWILSLGSIYILGFWSFILIPLFVSATKTIVKRCYDCNDIIEKHDMFQIPSINDKVLHFRFGNCAIILSRKYAYVIFFIFLSLFIYYEHTKEPEVLIPLQVYDKDRSWNNFVNDCGKETFISNGVKAKNLFIKFYENKQVEWTGIFLSIKDSQRIMRGASIGIFVKMNPSDAPNDNPDIVLGLEKSVFNKNKEILEKLSLGDEIIFKGNLEHMGDEFSYHTIRLQSIIKTGKNIELSQIDYFKVKLIDGPTADIGYVEPEDENQEQNDQNQENNQKQQNLEDIKNQQNQESSSDQNN